MERERQRYSVKRERKGRERKGVHLVYTATRRGSEAPHGKKYHSP